MNTLCNAASRAHHECRLARTASRADTSAPKSTLQKSLRAIGRLLFAAATLFAAAPAHAQTITATVSNAHQAHGVAINPVTNKIYVGGLDGTLTVIDGATNTASSLSYPNGSENWDVAVNPVTNMVYTADRGSSAVDVFKGATATSPASYVTSIATGENNIYCIAVNPVTNMIYTCDDGSFKVTVINGSTNAKVTDISTSPLTPVTLAVNPATNMIYVADTNVADLLVVNGATNAVATLPNSHPNPITVGSSPDAVVVNVATNTVYVANTGSSSVSVINGATGLVTATVTSTNMSSPVGLAVNPVTNQVFVADQGNGYATVIDGATNNTTDVMASSGGSTFISIAVDTSTDQAYLANGSTGTVGVINGSALTAIILTAYSNTGFESVAVNPVTHKAYAATSGSNTSEISVIDGATNAPVPTSPISTPGQPWAIAVDPVTNNIFVAGYSNTGVQVISGSSNTLLATVTGTSDANALVVDPINGLVYVSNSNASSVTVIDENNSFATSTVTINGPITPNLLAFNPVLNIVFGASTSSQQGFAFLGGYAPFSPIDSYGFFAGSTPVAIGTNPAQGYNYAVLSDTNSIQVSDSHGGSGFGVCTGPAAADVNTVTNTIYVACSDGNVSAIQGADSFTAGSTTTITPSQLSNPAAVAVNSLTNTAYVLDNASSNLYAINGSNNAITTINLTAVVFQFYVCSDPVSMALNPASNKIYVLCAGDSDDLPFVVEIDGATNTAVATVSVGINPQVNTLNNELAVNPVTGDVYALAASANTTTVFAENAVQSNGPTTTITPLTNNTTNVISPSFTFSTSTSATGLYFQVDSQQGAWTPATVVPDENSAGFTATASNLTPGFHILYAYATNGQDATSENSGAYSEEDSPVVGAIASYGFLVAPPIATINFYALNFGTVPVGGVSTNPNPILINEGGSPLSYTSYTITGPNANEFVVDSNLSCATPGSLSPNTYCGIYVTFQPTTTGPATATLTWTDNSLGVSGSTQSVGFTGTGGASGVTPPSITEEPSDPSYLTTATFGWTDSENGVSFQCSFTSGMTPSTIYSPCSTGVQYPGLLENTWYSWSIEAVDGSGNVSAPESNTWQVVPAPYLLSVTLSGAGTGTVTDGNTLSCSETNGGPQSGTCSVNYNPGTVVTLTAIPTDPSSFVTWGGACAPFGTGNSCTLTMNSNQAVTAQFGAGPAPDLTSVKSITADAVYGQSGSFTTAASNNGGISATSLYQPDGVAVDKSGNVYVADLQNSRVLYYPAGSTTATRVYGQGGSFSTSTQNTGGIGANSLNNPVGLALDSGGNLYVADWNNNRVLFYPSGSTTATRVYGQGSFSTNTANNGGTSATSLNGPQFVALDSSGNLYVADTYNDRVLFYPSGSTTATRVYGQGGSFSSANGGTGATGLNNPCGVAVDSSGDLYVADYNNNRVLFYPSGNTTATQVYGQLGSFTTSTANNDGVSANSLDAPFGIALDSSNNLYVADYNNNRVLFYPQGSISATHAYGQSGSFTSNGAHTSANALSTPAALALDSGGNLYVADKSNNRVVEYGSFGNVNVCPAGHNTPAPCNVTITLNYYLASTTTVGSIQVVTQGAPNLDFTLASGSTCTGTVTGVNTCNVNVQFAPLAPGLRTGAVQLFDGSNNLLASTLVQGIGQGPVAAFSPSPQTVLPFTGLGYPQSVAVDAAGDVFVTDNENGNLVELPANNGPQKTLLSGLEYAYGVAVDGAGDVYVTDLFKGNVWEIPSGGGTPSVITSFGSSGAAGLALDAAGDLFVVLPYSNQVVEIPANGSPQITLPASGLSNPNAVAVDAAGDVFIADDDNHRVVKLPGGAGPQTTVGTGLGDPQGIAVDAAGDVFIADYGLNAVVEVPAGGGPQFNLPISGSYNEDSVALDGAGDVFFTSGENSPYVVEFQRSVTPSFSFATTNDGQTSSDSPKSVLLQNIGNQTLAAAAPGLSGLAVGTNFAQTPGSGTPPDCTTTFSLTGGALCNVSIDFTPQSNGPLTGTALFTDNSQNVSAATQGVGLSGTGVAYYTLTITGAGTGTGEVSDTTNAITCFMNAGVTSGTCSHSFSYGTVVTLTAQWTGYSNFTTWGGDCSSFAAANPCTLTMDSAHAASAQFDLPVNYTLSVAGLGTGTGTISDGASINCTSTGNGATTGSCSASYPSGTPVTLTSTGTAGSSFGGWGGGAADPCTSSPATNPCSFSLTSNTSAAASFVPGPQSITLSFPAGTNVREEAIFDCPSNTNPCTDPNAHALAITVPQVLTPFTLTVTSTEIPADQADGICETGNTVLNDFDCRFVTFFTYGTVPSGIQVPLCYPYANGDCVHYDVYQTTPGNEPPTADYLGPVNWFVTFNDDAFSPPSPYTGSLPRLFDDPDYPVFPASPYGTDCTQPMQSSSGPEPYSCQFEFDITTSYVPGQKVDTGVGGTTKQFNDVVIAFPPNTPGEINVTSTPDSQTVTTGSPMGLTISLTNPGAGTDLNVTLQDPLPAGTGVNWSINTPPGQGTCSISGAVGSQVLSCSFGSIASLATVNFHITSGSSSPGNYINSATVNNSIQQILSISSIIVPSQLAVTVNGTGGGSVSSSPSGITCPGTCTASFDSIPVTLTATPNGNSTFAGWIGGGCSGVGTCTVNTAGAYQSVTATFNLNQYTLSISGSGTGSGTITGTGGIDCIITAGSPSGTCSNSYNVGTPVSMTATPSGTSSFAAWGVACSSFGSSNPCTLTMNSNQSATATFTLNSYSLSVAGLGTGSGTITGTGGISCTVAGNTSSGTCSTSLTAGSSVSLTATGTAGATFGGWGGGPTYTCTSASSTNPCTFTLNSNSTAAAAFVPAAQTITLSFPAGTNVTEEAIFDCPSHTNPCTDPDAHALALTVPQVLVPFSLNVTATEVSPDLADGICETGNTVNNDFDCRFATFFSYGTVASPAGVLVPLCYPYANGDCVHYNVYQGTLGSGNEPPTADYLGPVNWTITWNDDTFVAPSPYTGSQPRLFDDPDYAVFPTSAFGTNCADPMYIGSTPQSYSCQFEYDITTFYNPGSRVDSGVGGTTKQFNDVVVAIPPNTPGELNVATTPDSATVTAGSAIGYTITVTNTSSTGTDNAVTLQDPLPAGSGLNWSISPSYSGPGTCTISGAVGSQVLACSFGNLTQLQTFNFHITSASSSTGNYINSATAVNNTQQILSIAAINVTALTPSFGGLTAPSGPDPYGTPSITLGGTISSGDPIYATTGDIITITIGTASGTATVGSLGAFSGTVNISTLAASTTPYKIVYSFPGDAYFAPATNSSTSLTISPANQTITFTGTPASEPYNAQFTVSASSTSNLTVTIGASGSCSIASNTVTMTSGTGTCTLTASQSGNGNYNPATNVVQTVNATKLNQTITFTGTPASEPDNAQFTVSATSTSGLTVSIAATGSCSISSNTVTMTSGTGTCTLTASQAGNGNYNAAANVVNTVNATGLGQTITFTGTPASEPYNATFTVSATSTSGLTVSIAATGSCSISSNTVTMKSGTGTCTLTASQAGNSTYAPATNVVRTVSATPATQSITFTDTPTSEPYNATFAVSATSTSGLTVSIAATGSCSISSNTVTMTSGTGTCTLTAMQTGNSNYSAATPVVKTVAATKASSTTTITSNSPNPSTTVQAVTIGVKVTGTGSIAPTGTVTVTAKLSSTTLTCTATLSGGTGSCQVTLTTTGTWTLTAGYGGDSNFATSSTASGTSQTVNTAPSTLKFTPTAFNFGTVYVGQTVVLSMNVQNTGSSTVTFSDFDIVPISGDDSTGYLGVAFCASTLKPGQSATILMSFTADSQVTKTHAANLVITDNAAGSPQTIPMLATVINPIASVSPSSVSFGTQKTGTTSASKSVSVKNTGTTTLTINSFSFCGNFAKASSGSTCANGTNLAPNATCVIAVVFSPTTPKDSKSGTLTINDNAQHGTSTVSLSGTGN